MVQGRFVRCGAIAVLLIGVSSLLAGCISGAKVLPRRHEITASSFDGFDEAKVAYDQVQIASTTEEDLKALGFDPDSTPNIHELTYLQIIEVFMPRDGVPMESLPESVQECVSERIRCVGYAVAPKVVNQARVGNIYADFFDFRRLTKITGWEVDALFVLQDDVVVYKLWAGTRATEQSIIEVNPLGPVQDLGTVVNKAIPSSF